MQYSSSLVKKKTSLFGRKLRRREANLVGKEVNMKETLALRHCVDGNRFV